MSGAVFRLQNHIFCRFTFGIRYRGIISAIGKNGALENSMFYTILSPVTALCAFGWSTFSPSMSQRYCCGVSSRASVSLRGHWNTPFSNRLYSSTNPFPSQYSALIRSRRLPQNRNSVLVNGSNRNCCCTIFASPSIPLRRSV